MKTALNFTFWIAQGTVRDNPVEGKGAMKNWPVHKCSKDEGRNKQAKSIQKPEIELMKLKCG